MEAAKINRFRLFTTLNLIRRYADIPSASSPSACGLCAAITFSASSFGT